MVAFESLGVRSMCTFVRTPDLSILIDPSAACHARSGVKPHPMEYESLIMKRAKMLALSKEADAIATSHYHLDHLSPQETDLVTTFSTKAFADELYSGRILFCKDPTTNVTHQQGERGRRFHRRYSRRASRYEVADGDSFDFGDTTVSFSRALWHGKKNTVQGYVIGTCVADGDGRVVHASDVQLLNAECVDWMLDQRPDVAIVAGPPIFDGRRVSKEDYGFSLGLLTRLSGGVPDVIVDHHLLRSAEWRDFLAKAGNRTRCAAEREGKPVLAMESGRADLYEEEEVEEGFHSHLSNGRIPNRLRTIVHEAGMESIYRGPLRW